MVSKSKVSVLLCAYHPRRDFLRDQLESIARQTVAPFQFVVSDDSADKEARKEIERELSLAGLDVARVIDGPGKGFAANFLHVLAYQGLAGDYFAFSDQDDVWLEHKLEVAVGELAKLNPDIPAVYCGRTLLVDESNVDIGLSTCFRRPPTFRNALVQSIAGGNTMVLNRAARELVVSAGQPEVVSHDWWVYMLVTGSGGTVIYDTDSYIRYRQHETNLVGSNTSLLDQLARLKMVFRNRYKSWNDMNLDALVGVRHLLLPDCQKCLDLFIAARSGPISKRVVSLKKSGVHRQTAVGSLGLLFATITGKI
ncbi:glycosyltransferase [Marinobacter sp. SS5-14b]|uniref:glycosyltransferase n=1 Tax=Marinobacter sp. SS5-14b TaxID=3050456 RepID=UPI0026E0E287|nr:glycosyltransferase [Marinobacter sp. SS5-14b]